MPGLQNLLDPAILFFLFGIFAGVVRSNMEIPQAIARFLSLYLLMSIGLKGGFALAKSGLGASVLLALLAAAILSLVVPIIGYALLRRSLSPFNAAAIAATYGSVSATTFIAATQYLSLQDIEFGGHMSVALVLMESPAILMAMGLAAWARRRQHTRAAVPENAPTFGHVVHEAFTDGSHLLLLGSLAIGALTGDQGKAMMEPFSGALFKGMLAIFLLDMGLLVARQLPTLRQVPPYLLLYAVLGPLAHAALAVGLGWSFGLPQGDTTLLAVLAASSSYIVVPAVLRQAIPEAQPALYLGMSLGVTFVFNILVGIPLYTWVIQQWW
ncbi:sodium-dependent bicarbonate transport family permease [Aquabacterium fontiphilum]|uniref:sodium-dependent bicarbonate transport family permease n=1 Tax=Aquabacterium fontiphilum TaxID=450365 RepID=UPI00137812F1|nr:sodium-dependent bicarbonate transport family permease [Aquabacterium fontiphilum]NBD19814.1 sodium-dependent bicarbonate transport family permease [Aquabacterium fontiphilum]